MHLRALETLVFGHGDDSRVVRRGESFKADAELADWLVSNAKASADGATDGGLADQGDTDANGLLRVNIASAERIDAFVAGIGPETARKVVEWREQNGPFASIDDLLAVDGIGKAVLSRARKTLTVE